LASERLRQSFDQPVILAEMVLDERGIGLLGKAFRGV
jgi:hypothetical protein